MATSKTASRINLRAIQFGWTKVGDDWVIRATGPNAAKLAGKDIEVTSSKGWTKTVKLAKLRTDVAIYTVADAKKR